MAFALSFGVRLDWGDGAAKFHVKSLKLVGVTKTSCEMSTFAPKARGASVAFGSLDIFAMENAIKVSWGGMWRRM